MLQKQVQPSVRTQVGVVWPGIFWHEALSPSVTATTAIPSPVAAHTSHVRVKSVSKDAVSGLQQLYGSKHAAALVWQGQCFNVLSVLPVTAYAFAAPTRTQHVCVWLKHMAACRQCAVG